MAIKKVNIQTKDVADGDYSVAVPSELEPVFANPEFSKATDSLIEAIKHYYVVVKAEEYDRNKVIDVATQLLKQRA